MLVHAPSSILFPYTTLFRSPNADTHAAQHTPAQVRRILPSRDLRPELSRSRRERRQPFDLEGASRAEQIGPRRDRKSTRLNSSHRTISYAVFCLKKKT